MKKQKPRQYIHNNTFLQLPLASKQPHAPAQSRKPFRGQCFRKKRSATTVRQVENSKRASVPRDKATFPVPISPFLTDSALRGRCRPPPLIGQSRRPPHMLRAWRINRSLAPGLCERASAPFSSVARRAGAVVFPANKAQRLRNSIAPQGTLRLSGCTKRRCCCN